MTFILWVLLGIATGYNIMTLVEIVRLVKQINDITQAWR